MVAMARQALGETQSEFAKHLGLSQSAISKLEDGLTPGIDEQTLVKMVQLTNFPRGFFLQEGSQKPLRESFFRKTSTVPVKVLRQHEARINIRRLELEKLLKNAEPDPQLPLFHLEPSEFTGGPREIARHVRAAWGVPRGPIRNLISLIEDAGIIVIPFDFGGTKIDGVSLTTHQGTPIILYNAKSTAVRQRLTIAHELGHAIMHRIPTSTMEDEAFEFGAEFIMPEYDIKPDFFPLDLDRLIRLKQKWLVSMQAMIRWAKSINAMNERYYRYMCMKISKSGWRTNEPLDDVIPAEKPRLVHDLVNLHLEDLGYSPNELSMMLLANQAHFQKDYLSVLN